jgi:hypothetical protein
MYRAAAAADVRTSKGLSPPAPAPMWSQICRCQRTKPPCSDYFPPVGARGAAGLKRMHAGRVWLVDDANSSYCIYSDDCPQTVMSRPFTSSGLSSNSTRVSWREIHGSAISLNDAISQSRNHCSPRRLSVAYAKQLEQQFRSPSSTWRSTSCVMSIDKILVLSVMRLRVVATRSMHIQDTIFSSSLS